MMQDSERQVHSWQRPGRPTVLSRPEEDFGAEACARLLGTDDADLGWEDLVALFGPASVGTFEEVVYFLPVVFRHLQEAREGYAELTPGLAHWVSYHRHALARLGAKAYVEAKFRDVLAAWTASFRVTHVDEDECRAEGWDLEYVNIVERSEDVAAVVHNLVKEQTFAGVAESFVSGLSDADSATSAAWFLEFARWQEEGPYDCITGEAKALEEEEFRAFMEEAAAEEGEVLSEEDFQILLTTARASDAVRSERILWLVRDESLRERAATLVAGSELFDPEATYWPDTLLSLGMQSPGTLSPGIER